MTEEEEARIGRLIGNIECSQAGRCYESGSLKARLADGTVTPEAALKGLAEPQEGSCPYDEAFGVSYFCHCPLCSQSNIRRDPFWTDKKF